MPRNETKFLELVFSRDRDLPDPAEKTEQAEEAPAEEMGAIASCLEYLYGECMRLNQRLPAHLIGAAAESLRQEVTHSRSGPDTGSKS